MTENRRHTRNNATTCKMCLAKWQTNKGGWYAELFVVIDHKHEWMRMPASVCYAIIMMQYYMVLLLKNECYEKVLLLDNAMWMWLTWCLSLQFGTVTLGTLRQYTHTQTRTNKHDTFYEKWSQDGRRRAEVVRGETHTQTSTHRHTQTHRGSLNESPILPEVAIASHVALFDKNTTCNRHCFSNMSRAYMGICAEMGHIPRIRWWSECVVVQSEWPIFHAPHFRRMWLAGWVLKPDWLKEETRQKPTRPEQAEDSLKTHMHKYVCEESTKTSLVLLISARD